MFPFPHRRRRSRVHCVYIACVHVASIFDRPSCSLALAVTYKREQAAESEKDGRKGDREPGRKEMATMAGSFKKESKDVLQKERQLKKRCLTEREKF